MDSEPKKISFGFNKLLKKPNIIIKQPVEEKKCDIIEYIEEKSIKVIGGNDTPKGPLVIPMKESSKTKLLNLIDIVKNNFQDIDPQSNTENSNIESESSKKSENLSLEEQAAQELLNDTKNVKVKEESKRVIGVPKTEEKLTFEGEKESTLEDYEEIPIDEFGKAMLRGMGWKDGQGIGKNQQLIKVTQPTQRPKGMGLGADKMAKQDKNDKPAVDKDGNTLKCVKGCYVKIIAGYHKGNYGQIMGLDDESGRFIIKTALNNLNLSLNEFLVSPVTKEEYTKNSKVINNAKYEEYVQKKENEEKRKLEQIKKERKSHEEDRKDNRSRKSYSSEEEHRSRKNKYEDAQRNIKKERRYTHSDSEEENIKKERSNKSEKQVVKREKSKEEIGNKKHKNKSKTKSKYSSDSEDNRRSRVSSKYNSDEERDRKYRDRHKNSSKYASDSEEEASTSKKKSSKYDSDSEDYEQSRKKHKKKKSKRYSSDEETDDRYKKSSKKKEKKYESDSEDERDKKKKEKHKEKRNRSRHDRR